MGLIPCRFHHRHLAKRTTRAETRFYLVSPPSVLSVIFCLIELLPLQAAFRREYLDARNGDSDTPSLHHIAIRIEELDFAPAELANPGFDL